MEAITLAKPPLLTDNFQEWWAREDSNLQPDRYERHDYTGRSRKIKHLAERSTTFVHVWCIRFIAESLPVQE